MWFYYCQNLNLTTTEHNLSDSRSFDFSGSASDAQEKVQPNDELINTHEALYDRCRVFTAIIPTTVREGVLFAGFILELHRVKPYFDDFLKLFLHHDPYTATSPATASMMWLCHEGVEGSRIGHVGR